MKYGRTGPYFAENLIIFFYKFNRICSTLWRDVKNFDFYKFEDFGVNTGNNIVTTNGRFQLVANMFNGINIQWIPQAALKLIPSSEGGLQEYLDHDYVDVVVLFGDLLDGKYHAVNRHFKKFLALSPRTGASMIVFDDSDTSSAAEAVVDAAWGYQGMLPWTIDTVLIQENVFAMFTDKLKEKLASVRVGYGDDKLADISYPNCQALSVRQARTVRRAKDQGIEVYSPDLPTDVFAPTLLIGAKAYSNYVIVGGERDGCVTLLPFRSIDEAVNLTNNTRHGFGASVWTENVGLANEVAAKVTVGNVWLNGHGLIAPDVTFVSLKDSGAGYFGGAQGFREFTEEPKSLDASGKEGGAVIDLRVGTAINVAVGAGARWSKRAFLDRVNALREVADGLGGCFAGKFADELRRCVIDKAEWGTSSRPGYVVTPWTNARGVVAIDLESDQDSNASLLARALARGNAVIALNRYPRNPIYAEISKGLPSGLLSVFPHTVEMELVCANHKALNLFLSPLPRAAVAGQSVADSKNLTIKLTGDINWRLVFPKNVWYSVGRSLTCDL
ncbi:uncharacterized protein LOC132702435 isoform X2 [Cylas formicarius]|uniref:uncharacterized protein LOC132702435 isoform X2 n=1 Tax=Cylas formicarius TaxID=197179 RepID=UPI002958BE28|nr:uncharacterized protein LOC132702435 isoform X2 [Cylas formicarius]